MFICEFLRFVQMPLHSIFYLQIFFTPKLSKQGKMYIASITPIEPQCQWPRGLVTVLEDSQKTSQSTPLLIKTVAVTNSLYTKHHRGCLNSDILGAGGGRESNFPPPYPLCGILLFLMFRMLALMQIFPECNHHILQCIYAKCTTHLPYPSPWPLKNLTTAPTKNHSV